MNCPDYVLSSDFPSIIIHFGHGLICTARPPVAAPLQQLQPCQRVGESVLDLGEVAPRVLRKLERMMSPGQSSLQVPEQYVKPFEGPDFRSRVPARASTALCGVAQPLKHFKTQQPAGCNATARCYGQIRPERQGCERDPGNRIETHSLRKCLASAVYTN